MSNCTIYNDKFTVILRKPIGCIYYKHICYLKYFKYNIKSTTFNTEQLLNFKGCTELIYPLYIKSSITSTNFLLINI